MPLHMMLGPLLLSTALLGLSTAQCPLTLEPPELVQELGEAADVNCTTEDEGHRGIYWTYGGKKQEEDFRLFAELKITDIDWNSEASCTVKVNDTYECSERIGVKVYKRPTSITVQSNETAVDGRQLKLKCEIRDVAIVQNLTVTWYMNDTVVKTEPYYPSTKTTMNVTSFLMWNVSREQHGATFTCEASEVGPHGPLYVSNETWKMSVQYAPQFEKKESNINVNDSGDVILHCEAMGNPPPHYRWTKDGVTVENNTEYLNISRSQENESMTFECVASNDHGSDKKTFNVTVMKSAGTPAPAAPKSSDCPVTITPNEIIVKFGDPTSANCSTTETGADGIGWEASTGGTGLTDTTHLEWSVNKADWTVKAKCFINPEHGPQCTKPLSITVWKSPDKVQLSPNGTSSMVEGQPHQLKCEVFNVAPAEKLQVNWYQDGKLLHTDTDKFNGSKPTPRNVTLFLELTPTKEHNGANFTCETELLLGQGQNPKAESDPFTADVQYKPSILSCPSSQAGGEDVFHLDAVPCTVQGNPEPALHWYFNEKPVNSTKPLTRTESGLYTAKFTNSIGDTSKTIDITIEYAPSFSCKDNYNVTENDHRGVECEPDGVPKPKVVWVKDGTEIASPKMWRRQDRGQYSLLAKNNQGEANHTLHINVLYISKFSEEATTREFKLGENLTLECSADGNPPPQLQWKHPPGARVVVNTRGQHRNIYVTKATSSDAGLYSCTATNEVGSVSKNVTLMIIAEKTRIANKIVIILVLLAVLFILIFGVLLYRYCKNKSGHYDIVRPSESVLPLTEM